ncbi:helix-turn-helix domain-containing protein [Shewanella eurypsychrophilus]|uniref:Helix-turn-helix domain-containing protein n=1 Tax=Shewanella eurypsychrophilus TaxID=2593656 RepID=A0ABX6V9J8_9GAMM|nr:MULTISPECIES: helix-turn-helix domain-containing protein [Shewanella]QFU24150.1 helix-turn-helix domain-containing protein [Shewanella sp. YLB-09]QPG59357.1 helix-turn-helix domain-containing protein [Shewanella eurypsychrophilus]
MQLGSCQFDIQRAQLKNLENGNIWQLPRAELQVLKLLIASRNRVVAKHKLGAADENHPPLSDSSVTRAVFMLRSFLGPEHEQLIETVKSKGYRLRGEAIHKQSPHIAKLKPWLISALIIAILLIAIGLISQFSKSGSSTKPYNVTPLTLLSGQQINLISYSKSKTNTESLMSVINQFSAGFRGCYSAPWQDIYLSLSHDEQVFNITMRGEKLGQSVVRNLKLSDFRQEKQFISEAWLDKVALCE